MKRKDPGIFAAWLLAAMVVSEAASAAEPASERDDPKSFQVTEIRVEGLQRIPEGTLLNRLPVNIGDRIDRRRIREALRAVNDSGFFSDVELRREDPGILIVVVRERPSIRTFEIKGNKEMRSEDLERSLANIGLGRGKILNRSALEDVRQYLTEQYFARGRYGVIVDARVEEVGGNLVDVFLDITEGKFARIRDINIVGNERFGDDELLGALELRSSGLLSFYKADDRYARESLQGDLERIRSFYMDRGYANFEITSTQVTLAPEKQDLFITVNVFEGETFKIGAVKLAGRFAVPEEILRHYVWVKPGDVFSRRLITVTEEAIRTKLGENGFGFAEVNAVPTIDPATGAVSITFMIEPNARTYVRRIEFLGVERTRDDVLRREMRQLEGAALTPALVERSKERLQRLPYINSVETETKPVAGTADLVDVAMTVEEGSSSTVGGGLGYSERQSLMLQANFIDTNLFGSGERLAIELNGGNYSRVFSVSHTDPYFTMNNVSRSLNASYVERERLTSSFSQFTTSTWSAGAGLGYPLSEDQYLNFGLTYSHEDLATVLSSSTQLRDWVRNNGDDYFRRIGRDPILGTVLDTVELNAAWLYDSRDRTLFPTRGGSYRLNVGITPPGGSVSYGTVNFRSQQFFRLPLPLIEKIPFSLSTDIGYGRAFGDTTALPPHRHIFTGGSSSVRGFDDGTLGPRDSLGNPYGGDAGIAAQLEAFIPLPAKFATSARVGLFVDAGQSYYLGDTRFRDKRGDRTDYKFDLGEMRVSTGIGVEWFTKMGLFRFSYAIPLRYQEASRREFGDDIHEFQFSMGRAF
jgi:outer membrane protein insertion porin family